MPSISGSAPFFAVITKKFSIDLPLIGRIALFEQQLSVNNADKSVSMSDNFNYRGEIARERSRGESCRAGAIARNATYDARSKFR